jgi:hypothetical protein
MLVAALLLSTQQWNTTEARALVDRAIVQRRETEAELLRYTSRASGLVLFQAQVGEGPDQPARLIKADQLTVEVYWEAPNRSKQTITAWRERRFLPTDIQYHRDHLGIVTDDFGDRIRLGDGDEVRDVPHPLAPDGPAEYDYALGDSLQLASGAARITVREILVRPRNPGAPRAAGTLYLDAGTAALVRFRFGFTGAAYLQSQLEDITVVLERALFDQRFWLPWRQEIEIRRRLSWLNFPFRTIIRARWEIGDYDLTAVPAPARLAGGPYGGLRTPRPDTGWADPFDSVLVRAAPAEPRADLNQARAELAQLVSAAARSAQPPARLALGSLSELARVNRVEGLALGLGAGFELPGGAARIRAGYGFSSGRATGGAGLMLGTGRYRLGLEAVREVRDLSDWPTISGALNSVLSQESGDDHGDWLLLDRALAVVAVRSGAFDLSLTVGRDRPRSLETNARPVRGSYRLNPALGDAAQWWVRQSVEGTWEKPGGTRIQFAGALETGERYHRTLFDAALRLPAGRGAIDWMVRAGWASEATPAWRTFVLGGRGTLPGEPYRAHGGRSMVLVRAEWRVPLRLPTPGVGTWLEAGSAATIAPFAAVGWSERQVEGLPWSVTDGLRPVLGVASELLFNLFRVEAGWAPRTGQLAVLLDATPSWWPIL